jgi:hypothetical protein
MSFLPEKYESPKTSNYYLKLKEGENRIRILSKPILGWEDWTDDKKVFRFRMENKPEKSINPLKPIKHFWAFIVFNYNDEEIQIMNVTQATIRKKIEGLCKDSDWGEPFHYDIKIVKSGTEKNTEYVVNPTPHKPVDAYIVEMFREKPCYLEALFDNEDPFSSQWKMYTPIFSDNSLSVSIGQPKPQLETKFESIDQVSKEEAIKLHNIIQLCDPEYAKKLNSTISKLPFPCNTIDTLPKNLYERVLSAATKNSDEYQATLCHEEFSLF